jgi:hypothetical protein
MTSWGKAGALWGGVCGTLTGLAVLVLSLRRWAPEPLELFGILFGSPVLFAVLGGIFWGILGMMRDFLMASRDESARLEAERKEDENRGWHGVQAILKRNDLNG